jgi:hypothetical protein
MRKVIYSCDLCRKEFTNLATDIIGFEFTGCNDKEELTIKNYSTVERHWCKKCWKMVREMVTGN